MCGTAAGATLADQQLRNFAFAQAQIGQLLLLLVVVEGVVVVVVVVLKLLLRCRGIHLSVFNFL